MKVTIYEGIQKIINQKVILKTHIIPLEEALGKVSAKTLKATISLPRFNNSAMDGYGLKGEFETYKIIGKILAGDDIDITLKDGECIKITTGAKTPPSVETVIPQENCKIETNSIMIEKSVKKGANIRQEGEDIKKDEVIMKEGDKITSNFISLLASQGVTHIEVFKTPKVAVFASGSELKMPYERLEGSQIYNSNTPYFISRVKELGCEVNFVGKSKDSLEDMKELVKNSLDYDLIITSGGVSVGEADFTKEAFSDFGFETIFDKVEIKPGKPTTFGKIDDTFILNLPGNPLAAGLNFEIFAKVLINILSGTNKIYHDYILTKISDNFTKNRAVSTVIPGFFDGEKFKIAKQFSPNMVNVLNNCNGFIIIDKDNMDIKKDNIVKFLPIYWEFYTDEFREFLS
jgi:molybdopterin molybdotransferase